jgi:hypothetical protein
MENIGRKRQDIGPAARAFAAIAYDSTRQRAVLFSGVGQSLFGDTWEQFFQARKVLQTLEHFLGERFRFLEFGLFVVRAADADGNESIAF